MCKYGVKVETEFKWMNTGLYGGGRGDLVKKIMNVKIAVFRDMTSCSLVDRYEHFGLTFCLHLQG